MHTVGNSREVPPCCCTAQGVLCVRAILEITAWNGIYCGGGELASQGRKCFSAFLSGHFRLGERGGVL